MIDFKPRRRHNDGMTKEQVGILSFVCGMLFMLTIHVFISGVAG